MYVRIHTYFMRKCKQQVHSFYAAWNIFFKTIFGLEYYQL